MQNERYNDTKTLETFESFSGNENYNNCNTATTNNSYSND